MGHKMHWIKKRLRDKEEERGLISVEAITTLIIFIMFCVILIGFVNIIRAQIIIQSAVTETAKEISTYAYILEKADYFDLLDESHKSAEENNGLTELKQNYTSLMSAVSGESDGDVISEFETLINALGDIDSTKDLSAPLAEYGLAKASDWAIATMADLLIDKYLKDANGNTDYLENMGVKDGIDGLHFEYSHCPSGADDDLRITVWYTIEVINIPFFDNFSIDKTIVLNATTRVWGN